MKIVLSTSGSGGHTVPLKWIAQEIKKISPDAEIIFIGAKSDSTAVDVMQDVVEHKNFHLITVGKYRRYASLSKLQKLIDVKTNVQNFKDLFKSVHGLQSAYRMLKKINPDVVFVKGGAVSLPVGMAANQLKIPLVTHDSDTIAGFANKIVGKKAVINLVGSKHGNYPYDKSKIRFVGVPISTTIKPVGIKVKNRAKKKLGFDPGKKLILVSGGSLGAEAINNALVGMSDKLLKDDVQVLHQCGKRFYDNLKDRVWWDIRPFMAPEEMALAFNAADLMITRGSATFLAEICSSKIPAIIMPAPQLYDQVSNARTLSEGGYAEVVFEDELNSDYAYLYGKVSELINNDDIARKYAEKMYSLHNPNAARDAARIIVDISQEGLKA